MSRRGRGGQGNKRRGRKPRGPGKRPTKKRVSRKPKNRVNKKPRKISSKTKKKISSDRRKKRLSKITNKSLKSKIKSLGLSKKKTETKKKTISASQSRRQVRQSTRDKIATRRKINMPSLGQVGRTLRNIRQPISGLSSMAINSVLGRPGIASTLAQAAVNNLGAQNRRTRDMSKLSPQQQRKYQRLSDKTGRDYSVRNPTFRLNMNMRDIARFAGLDKQGWYSRVPASIRNAQVNKQFYGNPTKKGWHSSQRTGRGQGLRTADFQDSNRDGIDDRDQYTTGQPRQIPPDFGPRPVRGVPRERMGPQQDWLGDLYRTHNINKGSLDQGARDYWSNEAKTKGRDAVMQSIIGTSKAQGTYGGRKKPQRINTGSIPIRTLRGIPIGTRPWRTTYPSKAERERRRGGGGPIGAAAAISAGIGLIGGGARARRNNKAMRQQNRAAQKSYDLQAKGMKRRQGMLAKSIAATMAARGM